MVSVRRLVSTSLVVVAASAAFAISATGATISVQGDVFNSCCSWKTYDTIHKTVSTTGAIPMKLTNHIGNDGGSFKGRVYFTRTGSSSVGSTWTQADLNVTKNLATNVLGGTTFKIQSNHTSDIGVFGDTTWGGDVSRLAS